MRFCLEVELCFKEKFMTNYWNGRKSPMEILFTDVYDMVYMTCAAITQRYIWRGTKAVLTKKLWKKEILAIYKEERKREHA